MVLYYILYYIQAWYFCTILYVRRMFLCAALALPVPVSDCAFRWHGRVALLPVLSDSSAPVPASGCNFSAVPWSYSHFEAPAQASLLVALWLAFDTDHAAARHHWLSPPSHKNHCGTLLNSFAVKVATPSAAVMQEPKHCLTERNWCHLLVLGLNTASAMSCQNSDDATILLLGKIYFFWSSITADNSHTSFILNKKDRYPLWWLSVAGVLLPSMRLWVGFSAVAATFGWW